MPQDPELPSYGAIYAFGDSLSDAGNLSLLTASLGVTTPVSPPYYQEQYGTVSGSVFSNGPTWVQDLSGALGLGILSPSLAGGHDFAYGGAETGATPQNADNPRIQAISLAAQFMQFQSSVPTPSADALYTISIGANDLLDILDSTGLTPAQQTADVNAAVANEVAFARQLAGAGATNLLVLDVPDLGRTPTVLQGLANGSLMPSAALDAEASQLAAQFNASLASQLGGITGLHTTMIDAYRLIDAATATPAAYGLTDVTTPVWSGNYTSAASGTLAAVGTAAQDRYLFWDHLHPTEIGHQAIAQLAEQQLDGGGTASRITTFYTNILQRLPTAADLANWGADVSSGALTLQQVDYAIATSAEAQLYVVPIVELYTVFGRAPDAGGLQYWVHPLEGGAPLVAIAGDFLASSEGQTIYGADVGRNQATNAAFVDKVYQEALGRAADPAGAQGWTDLLDAGSLTPRQMLVDFIQSPEAQARDALPVTNFLLAAGNGTADYGGNLFAPSDSLQFLANDTAPPQGANATIPKLVAGSASLRDDFTASAMRGVAVRHGGSSYVMGTPDASGGVAHSGSATDPVFDLSRVSPGSLLAPVHSVPV